MGPRVSAVDEADRPGRRALAAARAGGYALLARLIADGVTPANRDKARLSPRVEAVIEDASMERLAADHFHVFGMMAPPFAGLLLHPEAQVSSDDEYLPTQLRILAGLCDRDIEAAAFIDQQVLPWLLAYEAAVHRCDRSLPSALISETVDLILNHRASCPTGDPRRRPPANLLPQAGGGTAPPRPSTDPQAGGGGAAPSPFDLDNPETDLRTIATTLSRPALSGVLLTKHDITTIGRAAGVPRGFGSRALMLQHLLRNAAPLDKLPAVITGVDQIVAAQTEAMNQRALDMPAYWMSAAIQPWVDRAAATRVALARIAQEATHPH